MFYKLVEREANNHLNVPIVSSASVCGLFYKQLSFPVRRKAILRNGALAHCYPEVYTTWASSLSLLV